jgi:hypothetical protein
MGEITSHIKMSHTHIHTVLRATTIPLSIKMLFLSVVLAWVRNLILVLRMDEKLTLLENRVLEGIFELEGKK